MLTLRLAEVGLSYLPAMLSSVSVLASVGRG